MNTFCSPLLQNLLVWCVWMWPFRQLVLFHLHLTHTANYQSTNTHLPPMHLLTGVHKTGHLSPSSLKTGREWNCLCMWFSFATAQQEQKPLQSACKAALTLVPLSLHRPPATGSCSRWTCSCSEQQQVIFCTSVTKGESVGVQVEEERAKDKSVWADRNCSFESG